MKKHYYSIVFFIAALFLLGWVSYSSTMNFKAVNQPLKEKIAAHYEQQNEVIRDFSYDLRKITNSNFFRSPVKPKKRKIIAKKTSLKLRLEGVVAADNNDYSRAVIRSNQKRAISYKIGDEIEGTNAELNSVEDNRVLLDRAGVIESLGLERKKIELNSLKGGR